MEARKNVVKQIVTSRRLRLGGSSAEVKSKIETDTKYAGLRNLCTLPMGIRAAKCYPVKVT